MTPRRNAARGRRPSNAAKRPQLLIFTEGEKTEPLYLMHWYRLHRARIIVKVDGFHGGPLQLVRKAADQQSFDRREAARGRGDAFDEYWCVFDRNQHPNLPEAMQLAAARGIMVAFSNPCIELWFLLHFTDQRAELNTRTAQRCSEHYLHCDKELTLPALNHLVARHDQARDRAQALDDKHAGDGSPAHSNPSSDVWRLIDKIRGT